MEKSEKGNSDEVKLIPIKTKVISPGEDLVDLIPLESLRDGDILVISSKAVSTSRKRLVYLSNVKPSERAKSLAKKFEMDEKLVEIILREADLIIGGVKGVLLTLKDGNLMPNAGVDRSNCPKGTVVLLPENPWEESKRISEEIMKRCGKKIGVVISDSRVQPLRLGTVGIALGGYGIPLVTDERGKEDLFGRELEITFRAVGDQIASAALLLMGENGEGIPMVVIRGVSLDGESNEIKPELSPKKCLIMGPILKRFPELLEESQ